MFAGMLFISNSFLRVMEYWQFVEVNGQINVKGQSVFHIDIIRCRSGGF